MGQENKNENEKTKQNKTKQIIKKFPERGTRRYLHAFVFCVFALSIILLLCFSSNFEIPTTSFTKLLLLLLRFCCKTSFFFCSRVDDSYVCLSVYLCVCLSVCLCIPAVKGHHQLNNNEKQLQPHFLVNTMRYIKM